MTNSKYNAHTDLLFKSLKLLKIKDIFDVQCMKIWYKFVNNNVPTYFASMLRYNRELYDIQTRSHELLHLFRFVPPMPEMPWAIEFPNYYVNIQLPS